MPNAKVVHMRVPVVLLAIAVCLTAWTPVARGAGEVKARIDAIWDAQRYIGIDEVKPGMDAYCLTDYGNGIEKFALKVLDVVHDIDPGRNAILVMGMDERFLHTGPVAGCSGSPVYIDGRLAGALAFGWPFAKDPMYGVTPIAEMLEVGLMDGLGASSSSSRSQAAALSFDFSQPIDVAQAAQELAAKSPMGTATARGATMLPCPVLVSGLSSEACRQVAGQLETMGFMATPGLSGSAEGTPQGQTALIPGCTLTMPVVTGDIKVNVLGTVTEVRDGRVYGFGHSFMGYGPTNLPMAGGKVYTVISSVQRSFKLGASTDIVGAITIDAEGAVFGRLGAKADMIPVSVRVERFNTLEPREFKCQVVRNETLTPGLVRSALLGAALQAGAFPPEHSIEYRTSIDLDDGRSIRFGNASANMELAEASSEITGALSLLMNNPFGGAAVKAVQFDVRMDARNIDSYLWSVDVADPKVKPGQEIRAEVVIESYLKEKRKHQIGIQVPKDLPAGKYNLMFLGATEYQGFLRKSVPYRYVAASYQTLVDALNAALSVNRTKLYCLLVLPPDGIMLEKAELPKLPRTKALVLQSEKRAVAAMPHAQWIETVVETGTIVANKEIVAITVEE
ncbi:MAG: hypothetical protein KBE65_07190 [Phycisphaerae bacterium]|nr:hypothetical protein [Phycisphaerae bacterium]